MARSLKKGPFIHYKLQKKIDAMNECKMFLATYDNYGFL